jgi:Na+/alanine symporter
VIIIVLVCGIVLTLALLSFCIWKFLKSAKIKNSPSTLKDEVTPFQAVIRPELNLADEE